MTNYTAQIRQWISRSEASDSDLPPKEHRLPEGWDEEDIIVNEDVAPVKATTASAAASPKKQVPPPAPITASPKKSAAAAAPSKTAGTHTEVSSPGIFPEGFFASPKSKKPTGDFPTATSASPSKKFNQAEENARLKTDAAPGLLTRLAGFFMKKKDGANGVVAVSPVRKLTGKRREREEEASASSDDEEETTGGDLQTQLVSMTPKQLEKSSLTVGELKEFAKENDISFNSKSKKADLITSCRNFAKKNNNASPSKPRAASSNTASPVASPAATSTAAVVSSPQKENKKKPAVRGPINTKRLFGAPPVSISKNDEPQEEWCVVQLKEWAKDNKVDIKDLFLKTQILQKCWEGYDAKH